MVRVEYNGVVLGESSPTAVLPDETAEFDFSTSFEYSPDGPNSLDVLVQKPLLCKWLVPDLPPWNWVLLLQESLVQE